MENSGPILSGDNDSAERQAKSIVDWLASVRGEADADLNTLQEHLQTVASLALPPVRYSQLLDFLYEYTIKAVGSILPSLQKHSLRVPRKKRSELRALQTVLETLSHNYLENSRQGALPAVAMWRAVNCLSLHLTLSHLAAAPPAVGIWRLLHSAHTAARDAGLADRRIPRQERTLEQIYLSCVLLASAQPASFTSQELLFIADYILLCVDAVTLSELAPSDASALFWIDRERDAPANPLNRRSPPPDTDILFFACDAVARSAHEHLQAIESGYLAHQLGLPDFANTPAGHAVLRQLSNRWGMPAKRKYPRRRHSYRATLCAGLDEIWRLLRTPENFPRVPSEWMVTNESPDGLAMMHMSGKTGQLRVGDLVAFRQEPDPDDTPTEAEARPNDWNICVVRWALSENPEHIELGLQILAPKAQPAVLAMPGDTSPGSYIPALLLPRIPPLRASESVIFNTGTLESHPEKFTLVVGQALNKLINLRVTSRSEQTANIEVFNVAKDERP